MKASINICTCPQVLGQRLKWFLNCFECVTFLQRQAGDWEKRIGKPTSYLFVLIEHPNRVQTARSFHGATPQVSSLAELQDTAFPKEQGKALVENTVHSNIPDRTKPATQELQWGKGWMISQIKINPASADVPLPSLYNNNNYCRPGKREAVMKGWKGKGKKTSKQIKKHHKVSGYIYFWNYSLRHKINLKKPGLDVWGEGQRNYLS